MIIAVQISAKAIRKYSESSFFILVVVIYLANVYFAKKTSHQNYQLNGEHASKLELKYLLLFSVHVSAYLMNVNLRIVIQYN